MSDGLQIATLIVAAVAGVGSPIWVTRRNARLAQKTWSSERQLPVYQVFAAAVSEFVALLVSRAPSLTTPADGLTQMQWSVSAINRYSVVTASYTALAGVASAKIGRSAKDLMKLVRDANTEVFVQVGGVTAAAMSHARKIESALDTFQSEYKRDIKLS